MDSTDIRDCKIKPSEALKMIIGLRQSGKRLAPTRPAGNALLGVDYGHWDYVERKLRNFCSRFEDWPSERDVELWALGLWGGGEIGTSDTDVGLCVVLVHTLNEFALEQARLSE